MFARAFDAARMYESGMSTGEIAKRLKVTYRMIYKYLAMEAVDTRRAKNKVNIVKLFKKNLLPYQIASKLGLSRGCVVSHIKAEGLMA